MSPVSVAGTLAQTLAEAMSGLPLPRRLTLGTELFSAVLPVRCRCKPGRHIWYAGTGKSAVWMCQTGAPSGCAVPLGGSLTGQKPADAQAAYESAQTLTPTVFGGVNFALHAAGWMEGGLVADYAKTDP
ncbi:MAG: hypothetical protein CM15mP46_5410 [Alphaproteobacteria bacterium]|nr:MAG: hypothetical protein CM15mP46_5410 [Alphaproteobacteria bacterium]